MIPNHMDQDGIDNDFKSSPEIDASPISKLIFYWLLPLLKKGSKKELEFQDVYNPLPEDSSKKLGNIFETKWKEEIHLSEKNSRPPKLWYVVRSFIWRKYTIIGFAYLLDELLLGALQPLILKLFIRSFSPGDSHHNQYLLATGFIFVTLLHTVIHNKLKTISLHLGMKIRLGVSSLVFRKVLRLQISDPNNNPGKLCNMLSSDVDSFDQTFQFLHGSLLAPVQLLIYSYMLFREMGSSAMGGVACILILIPIQVLSSRSSFHFRKKISQASDKRSRFLYELIRGIRLIKMYTWEKPFTQIVSKLRRAEIKFVRTSLYLRGFYVCIGTFAGRFITFCALIASMSMNYGYDIGVDKVFFTISILRIMKSALTRIPNGATLTGEMFASMERIQEFLMSNEKKRDIALGEVKEFEPCVLMKQFSGGWTEDHSTLKNLDVNLHGNKLVMVVGHVGCGKSSFLNAILSEMPKTSDGQCIVQGHLSYSSQEPWIFPATLKENILFGLEMDRKRYWKIMEICCLLDDLNEFPQGDMTFVGERGVALSGGQKARVNLARALYQQADIYLLDDPLSAVDANVHQQIFHRCIKENLDGKLRILVTHQLQYLPMADHVIVLNRQGEIWCQGTYEELKSSEIDFSGLINEEFVGKVENECVETGQPETRKHSDESKTSDGTLTEGLRRRGKEVTSKDLNCRKHSGDGKTKKEQKSEQNMYLKYFKVGGSPFTMILVLLVFLSSEGIALSLDYWLSLWTNSNTSSHEQPHQINFYISIYSLLIASFFINLFFRFTLFLRYCMKISNNIHDRMLSSVILAPVKFFDDNPSGKIMNRFTADLNQIDEGLPIALYDFISVIFDIAGMLIINMVTNHYTVIPSALLLFFVRKIWRFYLPSARALKRLDSKAKSPMFTHLTMTIQGLTTIRAFKAEKRVLDKFNEIQDRHTSVFYLYTTSNRWFAVTLEMLSITYLACICTGFLTLSTTSQSGSVGVAISSILGVTGLLQWGLRKSVANEKYLTSVERALEYCNLTSEAPSKITEIKESSEIPPNWPEHGRIEFQHVSLAYDDLLKNEVLKDISFTINPGEKVGIVGRTGAGKSSLITALFRLTEPCAGKIFIDDVSTKDISLHTLRSRISIIPQDPVLFTGTLRYNLDPFNEHNDEELWNVMEEVDLHHSIHDLDCPVSDGGSNFSVGQRQLVCLARAILRRNRILVLDEATANVDPATDQLIQNTIRRKFKGYTVLTIAHRLKSVLDSDRILVMDGGRVVEFDSPNSLMKNEKSIFHGMLYQSS